MLDLTWMDTSDHIMCGAEISSAAQSTTNSCSDANFEEVYRMLAAHPDPSEEDMQLQQEIGHLHPMEQRTFDMLMRNCCQALMSQESHLPMSFTFLQPQVWLISICDA